MPFYTLTTPTATPTNRKGVPVATSVNAATAATLLVAARSGRTGLDFINESTATCYVRYSVVATPASATDKHLVLPPNTHYEFPGLPPETAINAIWTAANGKITIVEWTES